MYHCCGYIGINNNYMYIYSSACPDVYTSMYRMCAVVVFTDHSGRVSVSRGRLLSELVVLVGTAAVHHATTSMSQVTELMNG